MTLSRIPISPIICTKANRTLGFLRRMLKKQLIKDWCAQSWNMEVLFGILIPGGPQEELENVQNRAARFETRN